MEKQNVRRIIIVIVCLAAVRGLIYSLVIPVDQTPDEIYHFTMIKAKQLALEGRYERDQRQVAAHIDLARYYLLYPDSVRQLTLKDVEDAGLPDPPSSLNLYYLLNACILRVLSLEQVRDEMYVVRGMSILCGTFVVFLALCIARDLFPTQPLLMFGIPLFITFVPQFSAMNGAINNDKLVEVFVASGLFVMVKILQAGLTVPRVVLLFAFPALALLSKRTAIFLLPLLVIFWIVLWWKGSLGIRMHVVLAAIFLAIGLGAYALMWKSGEFNDFIEQHVIWAPNYWVKYMLFDPARYSVAALKHYAKFFIVLYWSFWAVFGYMTIHLHYLWYVMVAITQMVAIGGLLRLVRLLKLKRLVLEPWKCKTLYLFAVSIVLMVMIPFLRSNIFVATLTPSSSLTQGRYLFAIIIPIGVLTMVGISTLIPPRYHRLVGVLGLLGMLMLDSVCLTKYLLLNFHSVSLF